MSLRRRIAIVVCVAVGALAGASSAGAASYFIEDQWSLLLVDIQWGSTAVYAPAQLWSNNGSQAQRFDKISVYPSQGFLLRAGHSGLCLSPDPRQSLSNGVRVVQVPCNSGDNRQRWYEWWFYQAPGVEHHVLENLGWPHPFGNEHGCLDIQNGPGANQPGMAIGLWDCVWDGWALKNQGFLIRWSNA